MEDAEPPDKTLSVFEKAMNDRSERELVAIMLGVLDELVKRYPKSDIRSLVLKRLPGEDPTPPKTLKRPIPMSNRYSSLQVEDCGDAEMEEDEPTTSKDVKQGILDDDMNNELEIMQCQKCKLDSCNCKNKTNKPWLSKHAGALQQIQSSDLTTADILEREVKNKKRNEQLEKDPNEPKRLSPFSEMSRRDEGDGRSIADSSYSSYKNNQFLTYHHNDRKTNKTISKMRTIPKRRNLPS